MNLPKLVSAVTEANGPGIQGPFLIGGYFYVLGVIPSGGPANGTLAMFRSNTGDTWDRLDSAGEPPAQAATMAADLIDGVIWVSHSKLVGSDLVIAVASFDTTSNTWTGSWVSAVVLAPGAAYAAAHYRADDTIVIAAGTASVFTPGDSYRTAYVIFDAVAHTFSAAIPCGDVAATHIDCQCFAVVAGIGEVVFVFALIDLDNIGVFGLAIQTLSNGNALGTYTVVNSGDSVYVEAKGNTANLFILSINSNVWDTLTVWTAPLSTLIFTTETVAIDATLPQFQQGIAASDDVVFLFNMVIDLDAGNLSVQVARDTGSGFGAWVNEIGPFDTVFTNQAFISSAVDGTNYAITFWQTA